MAPCMDIGRPWAMSGSLSVLLALVLAGCGGGETYFLFEGPVTVQIDNFQVTGNDASVNGREQIVAGINNGMFNVALKVDHSYSDDATVWVSDREDLAATDLEQEVAHYECGYYPFCDFDFSMNCSFSPLNQISCAGTGGSGPIDSAFPQADLTPLLNGNQSDLYLVVLASANGAQSSIRAVPVTFRHN